jgi:hypothetical protein
MKYLVCTSNITTSILSGDDKRFNIELEAFNYAEEFEKLNKFNRAVIFELDDKEELNEIETTKKRQTE